MNTEHSEKPLVANPDELGTAIAELAPDVSWTDDLPIPTPAEIRERVNRFTPEQRAAAEQDAVRAELGQTALTLAKGLAHLGKLDDAEQWLTIAEEYAVPEARELLNQLTTLRPEIPDISSDDVFLDEAEGIVANAVRKANQILQKAQSESEALIDAALAKVQEILDRTRYNAAKANLSLILDDLGKVDPGGRHRKPTLLWLLWLLLDRWGLPIAKPVDNAAKLSAVRVARGTPLANLLSPAADGSMSTVTRFTFRVLLLPASDRSNCAVLTPSPQRFDVRMNELHALKPLPDWARLVEGGRLLVVLPSPPIRTSSGEPDDELLMAVIEHLVPGHGLSVEQVRRLSWETVYERFVRDRGDTAPRLQSLNDTIQHGNQFLCAACVVAMNGEIDLRWPYHDLPVKDVPDEKRDLDVGAVTRRELPCPRQRTPDVVDNHRGARSPELSAAVEAGDPQSTVDSNMPKQNGIKETPATNLETRTLPEAWRALKTTDEDYLMFTDADSGRPAIVCRGPGTEPSVMKLGEMQPTRLGPVEHEAMRALPAQVHFYGDTPIDAATTTESPADPLSAGSSADGPDDAFDEFLIIECAPQAS